MMSILELLSKTMKEPIPFGSLSNGWFHYISLVFVVFFTYIFTRYLKHKNKKQLQKYLFIFAIILIAFEIYKQVLYSYSNAWHYRWYAFPFQFCSIPMYVALITALTKKETVYEAGISFLATYGLFAGLAVMLHPGDVFVDTIGINIQTMIHHGGIATVGFSLIFSKQVSYKINTIIKASVVFSIVVLIAILLNTIYNTWINEGTFNMFFINPKYTSNIPILFDIQPHVNAIVFYLIYYFGFTLVALIVFKINMSLIYIFERIRPLEERQIQKSKA
jgi:hypothetical protein